jgi:hypothetical protein
MMKRMIALVALLLGIVAMPAGAADDDKGWTQLFNGKDTTGWKLHEKANPKSKWEVKDGLLVGSGEASMLYSERGDYENFHFRIEAKINDKGNSGQYFRAAFVPGFQTGYEAQINATHRDAIKTGSLYLPKLAEVLVKDKAPHAADEFFVQEVIANGNHIVIKVNGKVTVDWKDPDAKHTKGHFALQQHDPGSMVSFKKIEVKELPATKK